MSAQQSNNFRLLKQLLLQLRAFGLNPYDWRIERSTWQSEGAVSLRNRADQEFRLRGEWTRENAGRIRLVDLRLASL